MGRRGPKPLPANVLRFRGASHVGKDALRSSVEPEVAIPSIPKHLLPAARKFWRHLTPHLESLGLISEIDQASLALVCQHYAWWVWNDQQLQRDVNLSAAKRDAFEAKEAERAAAAAERGEVYETQTWTGGDGVMIETKNGSWTYNPHWVAANKHSLLLDKFLASFGMSPSARGRVTPSSRQMDLPGIETPKEGFNAL